MSSALRPYRKRPWYSPVAIGRSIVLRPRVWLAALMGAAIMTLLPRDMPLSLREVLAWNGGGIVYLTLVLHTMRSCSPELMEARAARHDDSRVLILLVILLAIASSFAGIAALLAEARTTVGFTRMIYIGLTAATIVVSWTVTQFVFTMHYAHEFYRPEDASSDARRGLVFPECPMPDYWDFLYFATSIGATSQTSDVAIRSRAFRRLVTLHAVVSFVFNTMVLALTINLAASLAS